MDILLTHGYFLREDPHEALVMRPYPPLGVLYLASHLASKGFGVGVFDATFREPEAFAAHLRRERPAIVGISANLLTRRRVIEMLRLAREQRCVTVVGGPEAAVYPEEYLSRGADVVVLGEGELTLEELVPHLARQGARNLAGIRGIAFLEDPGRCVLTPARAQIADLDAQPFPARDLVDIGEYLRVWRERHGYGSISLLTARGCPYRCAWCSHAVFGYSHRRRTPGNVAAEVAQVLERYRPERLWYADDVFTMQPRWLFEFQEALRRRGLRIPFEASTREDRLDESVVQALSGMGCERLWLGSESGSQRILDAMQRQTSAARTREMARLLRAHGIRVGMFVMFGYEGEEPEDIATTLEHLKEADPDDLLTTLAYPLKGTPYYERVAARVLAPGPWESGSDREATVAGRHSRRFYRHATRWVVSEFALHQMRRRPGVRWTRRLRRQVSARLGRLGMRLTRREVEGA